MPPHEHNALLAVMPSLEILMQGSELTRKALLRDEIKGFGTGWGQLSPPPSPPLGFNYSK